MQSDQIITAEDFRTYIRSLIETTANDYPDSLETYLRALWKLLQAHRQAPCSYRIFAHLLTAAFTTEPDPFDERWMRYTSPPNALIKRQLATLDDFQLAERTLLYQIADLQRMVRIGLFDNPGQEIMLGVISPTGYSWYNFHPTSYLECASGAYIPEELLNAARAGATDYAWRDVADFLWRGQIYE